MSAFHRAEQTCGDRKESTAEPSSLIPPVSPNIALDYDTAVDPKLQVWLEQLDARLQQFHDLNPFSSLFDQFSDSFDGGPDEGYWEDDPW